MNTHYLTLKTNLRKFRIKAYYREGSNTRMQLFTISALLDFIVNRFLVVFILCFAGSLVKDVYDSIINLNAISIKRIFVSSLIGSIVMSAILDYIKLNMAMCGLVCFVTGAWSFKIFTFIMSWDNMKILLKHIFKNSKTILGDSLTETIEELNDVNTSEKKQIQDNNHKEENKEE